MNIIEKDINEIIPYINNPRKNDAAVDKVAASIKEFGWKVPCVITTDNVIITGHTRIRAAKKLGIVKIPCIRADDLTEAQIKAYRLADNKVTEFAEWDLEKLEIEFEGLGDFDLGEFGFEFEIDEEEEDPEIEEDEIPEKVDTRCKLGDLWILGEHRLICGDCTDINVVEKLMGGGRANLIFTDPPYGMNLDTDYSDMINHLDFANEKHFKGGKKYEQGKVDDFQPEMINTIFTIEADEVFLWGADYYAELLPDKNKGSWIVWDKRANGNNDDKEDYSSDKMYGSCFELCWSKKKHKRDIARVKWAGVFGTEQEFDHKRYHPTQKPAKLAAWFLERYSKRNDLVVDIFGGSGSTLIACEQLGRKCYMCELDEHYCDVIIQRWENLTGEKAERSEQGCD